MADEIIQEVLLRGQEDIKNAFASIERAGVQMFANLERASELGTFGKVVTTISAITVAVTGAAVGMFKWAESSAAATTELGRLADQGGTTIENISTLTAALKSSSDVLGTAFKRFAVRIEAEWPVIQKAQRDATNLMIADNLAVSASFLALERAQVAFTGAQKTLAQQEIQNSLGIRGAELSLVEAIEKRRLVEGGVVDPSFDERIAKDRALLAVQQAQLALETAKKKAAEDAELAANSLAQKRIDLQQAQLKLSEDIKKRNEDSLNDINKLAVHVDNLSKGITDANVKVNASAENILKGLLASVGTGAEGLSDLKDGVIDLASAPPKAIDAFLKLSDVFKNTQSNTLKTAIAVSAFGRGVGQELVEQMSKGSASILAEQKRLTDLGLVMTDLDRKISKDLKGSLARLSNDLSIISKQFGLIFAADFAVIIKNAAAAIENGRTSFLEFGKAVEQVATPAIVGFLQAVTGKDLSKGLDITDSGKKAIESWTQTFTTIKTIVVSAASIIGAALGVIAGLINKVFGDDFVSKGEIALSFLVLRFIPAWGRLATVVFIAALALDRFSEGLVSRGLDLFLDSIVALIEGVTLLAKLLTRQISFEEFEKASKDLDRRAAESTAKFVEGKKKAAEGTSDSFDKAGEKVAAAMNKAGADSAVGIDKITTAADRATAALKKTGDQADETINALNRQSGIKPISGTDAGIFAKDTKGEDKIPSASKSFGALAENAKLAQENVDALDKSLGAINVADLIPIGNEFASAIQKQFNAPLDDAKQKATFFLDGIKELFSINPIDIQKWNIDQTVFDTFFKFRDGAVASYLAIKERFRGTPIDTTEWNTGDQITSAFGSLTTFASETWTKIQQIMKPTPISAEAWNQPALLSYESLVTAAESAYQRIVQIFSKPLPVPGGGFTGFTGFGGGGPGFGFAGGTDRPLSGPGSWTSDSIPAWVSVGEAILQSPAVSALTRFFGGGIIGFLNNFHKIAGRVGAIPRFNMGGFLQDAAQSFSPQMPRFNTGALIESGVGRASRQPHSGLTLNIGNKTFVVEARNDVVADIRKAAIIDQAASQGPSPNWKRG